MSWCQRCLTDHAGLCLDERRRLEFGSTLGASRAAASHRCPYCGVDGRQCPVRQVGRDRCNMFGLTRSFAGRVARGGP